MNPTLHQFIQARKPTSPKEPEAQRQAVETPQPSQEEALLRRFLQESGARCPVCNYNCHGLTVPRCPECGRELKLTLGVSVPYVLPWTLLIICVAMAGSIGILLGGFGGRNGYGIVRFLLRSGDVPLLLAACYGLLAVPLLAALVIWRRRFFGLAPRTQWMLAGGAFIINALLVAVGLLSRSLK